MDKERILKFISENKFQIIGVFLVTLLGFYLRLISLDKPAGFWFDESASYITAIQSFPFGILNKLQVDLHAPLYFFILHFWMKLFGTNDCVIRLLSVIFGTLAIPVSYLVGKELKSSKVGFVSAILVSINSLFIYYSQEVKFYSLLILLGSLSILFILKILKNPKKSNYIGLILSNTAILYTFTIGCLFVFLEALIFLIYLYFKKKEIIKEYLFYQLVNVVLYLPFVPFLVSHINSTGHSFINVFWWAKFNWVRVCFVIQDWFSPIIINVLNPPLSFYQIIWHQKHFFLFFLFAIVPILILIFGIIWAVMKSTLARLIFLIAFSFFASEIILSYNDKLAFMSRYTILSLPIMLITASYGLALIKNKFISKFLISILIVINLFYLLLSPISAPKLQRVEAFKDVAILLNHYPLNSEDTIIMPYGGIFMGKYYSKKVRILPFDFSYTYLGNDQTLLSRVFDKELAKSLTKENAYEKLNSYIGSITISQPLEKYIKKEVIDKLGKKRYVALVISEGVASFDDYSLIQISQNYDIYKDLSLFPMLCSKTSSDLIKINSKYLHLISKDKKGVWDIYLFQK